MDGQKLQEVSLKELIKIVAVNNKMTLTEVAEASGRTQSSLSNALKRGNINVSLLRDILKGCKEPLVISISNGQKYILK